MPHVSTISNVLDDKGRLRNLDFVFGEYAGDCEIHKNDALSNDLGEKLSGARTEVLQIYHPHPNLTLVENNFRSLSSLRELGIDFTE